MGTDCARVVVYDICVLVLEWVVMVAFPFCSRCGGLGKLSHRHVCPDCGGRGVLITDEMREVLADAVDPFEVYTAGDGKPAVRTRTGEELADALLEALVDYLEGEPNMRLENQGGLFDLSEAGTYWWCGQSMVWEDGPMPRDCSPEAPHSSESGWCGWALVVPEVDGSEE